MKLDLKNKRTLLILGIIVLVFGIVFGYAVHAGYILQPKEVRYVQAGKKPKERLWIAVDAYDPNSMALTGQATLHSLNVTKDGRETSYVFGERKLSDLKGKSDKEIIEIAKKDDKDMAENNYNYKVREAKSSIKVAQSDLQYDKKYAERDKQESIDSAKGAVKSAQENLDDANEQYQKAKEDNNSAKEDLAEYDDTDADIPDVMKGNKHAVDGTQEDMKDAQDNIKDAQKKLDDAKKRLAKAEKSSYKPDTNKLDEAKKELNKLKKDGFTYKAPKAHKIEAEGKTDGTNLTEEFGYDGITDGTVDGIRYSGYTKSDSSNVLITKMANNKQTVAFDKPEDVKVEN